MNALATIVCFWVRAEIFRVFGGVKREHLHLREVERRTGFSVGAIRQDLEKLSRLDLLVRERVGNRVYYSANDQHPLYIDLHHIVLKTVGLTDMLRKVLDVEGIKIAFIFGSIAKGGNRASSDIDLVIIGSLGLRQVTSLLSGLSDSIGRELNPHVMTEDEWFCCLAAGDHFVVSVFGEEKLFIIGGNDDLAAMG